MCGIFGFSHTTDVTRRMAPHLAWAMESRGKDSWGATDGTTTVKVLGPITDGWYEYEDEVGAWERGIFHTRAASHGTVSIPNQHPFTFDEGAPQGGEGWLRTLVGIHNGIIANHSELNRKYSRKFEVDSMHIFKHLAERRLPGELQGYGNLAWYEMSPKDPTGTLHLLRFNSDALHIARLDTGEIVFASEKDPIERAAVMAGSGVRSFWNTESERIYYIKVDAGDASLYKSHNKLAFGTRTSYQACQNQEWWNNTDTRGTRGTRGGGTLATIHRGEVLSGLCAVVGCHEKVVGSRKTALLCPTHFAEVRATAAGLELTHV